MEFPYSKFSNLEWTRTGLGLDLDQMAGVQPKFLISCFDFRTTKFLGLQLRKLRI